jgi:hypothetical protein
MTDKTKVLDRIRKCLALAGSNEPHEAAAALRQAKALMEKYGISDLEASLADIGELECKSSGKTAVPVWEAALAKSVGEALGCRVMHRTGSVAGQSYVRPSLSAQWYYSRTYRKNGRLFFIGADPRPEIARYAFEILRRQLRKARGEYRHRVGGNAKRVEAFVLGWVFAVQDKVKALAAPLSELERVDAAIAARHGKADKEAELGKDRSGLLGGDPDAVRHAARGMEAGREVDLHSGVGLDRPAMLTGGCQ